MKKLSYGIAWICVVLLICMAYYGSYELGARRQSEHAGEETRVVTGNGENEYILKVKDGVIQVYQSDGETLYESTGIPLSVLPEEMQREVSAGKTIEDSAALYSFLENYSS